MSDVGWRKTHEGRRLLPVLLGTHEHPDQDLPKDHNCWFHYSSCSLLCPSSLVTVYSPGAELQEVHKGDHRCSLGPIRAFAYLLLPVSGPHSLILSLLAQCLLAFAALVPALCRPLIHPHRLQLLWCKICQSSEKEKGKRMGGAGGLEGSAAFSRGSPGTMSRLLMWDYPVPPPLLCSLSHWASDALSPLVPFMHHTIEGCHLCPECFLCWFLSPLACGPEHWANTRFDEQGWF